MGILEDRVVNPSTDSPFPPHPPTSLPILTGKQASNCHVIADRLVHHFNILGYWPIKRNRIRRGVRLELSYRPASSSESVSALQAVPSPVRVFYVVCDPDPLDCYETPTESRYTIRESGVTSAEVSFAAYSRVAYKLIERLVSGLFCSPVSSELSVVCSPAPCPPVPSSDDRLLSGCSIRRPVKSLHRLIPQYNGQYNGSLSNGESGLTIDNSSIDKPSL